MLKHGVGPSGPGIGETLVDKTARVSSWSRFGRGTRHVAMLNETALTGAGIIMGEEQMAFYFHVDDGLVIGKDPDPIADVTSALHTAADALEDIGFTVTDRRVKQQVVKVIGYVPLASPALVKPPASTLALLHLSLGELLAQDSIYVPLLKSIIGS